ncbi:MAG: flagellar hook-basal body complex protein FliE [Syntrophobacterales bacterium]|nr:flagellar hook-basal body complex protein FliE [Syntrophobacterales bacterium]
MSVNVNVVSPDRVATIEIATKSDGSQKGRGVTGNPSFVDEMGRAIKRVDAYQKRADQAMEDGAIKGAEDIHEAMIRLQEAEISLRMFMQVKNKALEAYREIMRLQV